MKILYVGCHEILEFDTLTLFTELDSLIPEGESKLNLEIFSLNGAYMNPLQSGGFSRTVIKNGRFYPKLYGVGLQSDKDDIHDELLDWCDVVFMTHNSAIPGQKEQQRWVVRSFEKIHSKKKKMIWQSIGQCTPELEKEIKQYRDRGMNIVRMSPLEEKVPQYAGHDAIIRFHKDEDEFNGWTGEKKQVITITQSFKQRGHHLGYTVFEDVTHGFNRKVYGSENADLGDLWGGFRSYNELKDDLRKSRVYFYFGTQPVPYTLTFIEAMLTGIPVVAVGPALRGDNKAPYPWPNYEVHQIISNGVNGYVSNDINELRGYIQLLLDDEETAKRIGEAGRNTAIKLFGKKTIAQQWIQLLKQI